MYIEQSAATVSPSMVMDHPVAERRQKPRVPTRLRATFRRASSFLKHRTGDGVVTNYSKSGACVKFNQPLDLGEWITVRLHKKATPSLWQFVPKKRAIVVREIGRPDHSSISPSHAAAENTIKTNFENTGFKNTGFEYGVRFSDGWSGLSAYVGYQLLPLTVMLMFIAGTLNVVYLKSYNVTYFWYSPLFNLYSLLISIYILSRFALAIFYRVPKDNGYMPTISVIVACKNEQDSIAKTLECIFQSNYPQHLMQVIAVNDGSTDKTLHEMLRVKQRFSKLQVINFPKNLGKRHGMAAGAQAAHGDILVYIDSDSFVRHDTFRKLVRGFADPTVGAVCGHANVSNARANLLTKMQEVRYFVAFRVIKAAESLLSTVSCCSGCLAAYRREYVMPILKTWLNQSFLGTQATFGDDRSLTNFMLRRYRVIYDADAVCTTLVPESYRVFFRQQLRWKKSWIRESLIGSTFMWRRHPLAAFFYYLGALFPIIAPLIVLNALFLPLAGIGHISYLYVYGVILMATLYGLVYLGRYRDSLWVYGISFSVFYMTVLVWQTYYALLTVRRNHWGTR